MVRFGLAVLVLTGVVAEASAERFEYDVSGYPADGDCHETAGATGELLEQATGAAVVGAFCTELGTETFSFRVVYEADERLPRVTTDQIGVLTDTYVYDSRDQCEGALSEEVSRFERATGLAAVVGYCASRSAAGSGLRFGHRIDGFGVPARSPRLLDAPVFGAPEEPTVAGLLERVANRLPELGLDELSFVAWSWHSGFGRLSALVYSAQRRRLLSQELTRASSLAECRETAALAEEALASDGRVVSLVCARLGLGLGHEVTGLLLDEEIDIQVSAESFNRYESCMAEREALFDLYVQQLGVPAVGALCSRADTGANWRVHLLLGAADEGSK